MLGVGCWVLDVRCSMFDVRCSESTISIPNTTSLSRRPRAGLGAPWYHPGHTLVPLTAFRTSFLIRHAYSSRFPPAFRSRSRIWDWMLDVGCWVLDVRSSSLAVRDSQLAFGIRNRPDVLEL